MKEKSYYEFPQFETILEIGEVCFSLIKRLDRGQARSVRETDIAVNGKNYQITIEEQKHGVDKIRQRPTESIPEESGPASKRARLDKGKARSKAGVVVQHD